MIPVFYIASILINYFHSQIPYPATEKNKTFLSFQYHTIPSHGIIISHRKNNFENHSTLNTLSELRRKPGPEKKTGFRRRAVGNFWNEMISNEMNQQSTFLHFVKMAV